MESASDRCCVGVDVSKRHWDIAVDDQSGVLRFAADAAGLDAVIAAGLLAESELGAMNRGQAAKLVGLAPTIATAARFAASECSAAAGPRCDAAFTCRLSLPRSTIILSAVTTRN
jgi:hypothetical protein